MPLFSHYEGLDDISGRLSLPALVFSLITPLVVLARFIARFTHGNHVGADDWTILVSCCFAETVSVLMIICCEWGFGKHTRDLPKPLVAKTLELYFYAQIFYKITFSLTKISILLLYLRVFGVWKTFRYLCWIMIGVVVSFSIATVITSIFQCSPVAFAFDKTANHGKGECIDLTKFWYANAGFNIGSDAIIIVMPILPVKSLNLPTRSKIALCGLFTLGIFVCITSILRFTTLNIATAHTDVMWQSIPSSMWTVIEYNLGIIAASIPALRRPLAEMFPRLLGRIGGTSADRLPGNQGSYPTRAPSTISTASTKTSRFSSSYRGQEDHSFSQVDEKDERYRSGLRTTFYDGSDHDIEKALEASDDRVATRDFQTPKIVKTVEVDVRPGSSRNSFNQYRVFPQV
ncbi:hypothetical protein H2200_000862 [Cladophialophora chaetospira]|uniref:Rhodopsin domain-containing protein n=1 Tax=Cladophialophora chaetospira TaxID=386627 RepID=A0AA39CRF0_9EURO|nr:hypothetical protein H2200_000862 [Cladophialophora chaetospira]